MFSNFRSPNKVYVREICSNDCRIYQGGGEHLGSPAGLREDLCSLRTAGGTRKAAFPRGGGIRAPRQRKTRIHNTTRETGAPEGMFRLPEERWRRLGFHWRREEEDGGSSGLDSEILTFDPDDPSVCYTLPANKEHQEKQPTTKEEGKQPKHSRQAKYKLHRGAFLPPGGDEESRRPTFFLQSGADYLGGGKHRRSEGCNSQPCLFLQGIIAQPCARVLRAIVHRRKTPSICSE